MGASRKPNDLGRTLRELARQAVSDALKTGQTSVAAAVNIGRDSRTAMAYSDDEITIIQRDGETTIIRRGDEPAAHREGAEESGEAQRS